MKLFINLFLLFSATITLAQEKVISVTENNNDDGSITLIAHNSSNQEIELEISLNLRGISTSVPSPVVNIVPANGSVEMTTLKQTGSPASYTYSTSYSVRSVETPKIKSTENGVSTDHSTSDLSIPEKGILVFSKNGCGRCTYAHNYLEKNSIDFKEINISESSTNKDFFWDTLRKSGFNKRSVKTPVLVVDGKVHTHLPDLKGFLKGLKTSK